MPGLDESGAKQWMGHRPATPDSLPVIGPSSANPRLLYAFGHGHLGLTQSASTGELIGALVEGTEPRVDLTPYSISRFSPQGGLAAFQPFPEFGVRPGPGRR